MKKFIFKDEEKNTELLLPVTPPSFEISHGINIETINIHSAGDVILPGYGTLSTIKIDCMFPMKKYPFNQPGTRLDPYGYYIKKIEKWRDNRTVLRFVISDTGVNEQVIISEITYGEKDGTGDVYASVTMRQYRKLSAVQTNKTGNKSRSNNKKQKGASTYVIKPGDTLGAICRKYYGNASLSKKLATYNGIKNPNLIIAGKTLKLPDQALL